MSNKMDAQLLRAIAESQRLQDKTASVEALNHIVSQLESDAKRDENYDKLQEIGKCAYASIAEMVAALKCDYDRLEELASEYADWVKGSVTAEFDLGELNELREAAGDCESRDDAEQRIHEDPLSVQVRSGWYEIGGDSTPEEFEILLGTGGPATRIIGELDEHGQPTRARLQAQDWGTQWTDYRGGDSETLLTYCRCFYFGEG